MLLTRVSYKLFVVRQSYHRNFCDGFEMKFRSSIGGIKQLVHHKQLRKAILLVFTFG